MQYEFKNKSTNSTFSQIHDITPQEVLKASAQLNTVREVSESAGELGIGGHRASK